MPTDTNLAVEQARAAYQQAVPSMSSNIRPMSRALADVRARSPPWTAPSWRWTGAPAPAARCRGEELSNAATAYDRRAPSWRGAAKLAAQQVLVKTDDVDANPEVMAARAALDVAPLNLKRTEIRSPVDGVVAQLRRPARPAGAKWARR